MGRLWLLIVPLLLLTSAAHADPTAELDGALVLGIATPEHLALMDAVAAPRDSWVPLLENLIASPQAEIRSATARALGAMRASKPALQKLAEADPDETVQLSAAVALARMGGDLAPARAALTAADFRLREYAADTLLLRGDAVVRTTIFAQAHSRTPEERLAMAGPLARAAARVTTDKELLDNTATALALSDAIGPLANTIAKVPVGADALLDRLIDSRMKSVSGFAAALAFASRPGDPRVIRGLTGAQDDLRRETVCNFCQTPKPEGYSAMESFLSDPMWQVRECAIFGFQALGVEATARAMPLLIKALQDKRDDVVNEAACTIGDAPDAATDAIAPLMKVARGRGIRSRGCAAATLAQLDVFEVAPVVIGLLGDSNHDVKQNSLHAAKVLGAKHEEFWPLLAELLHSPKTSARAMALMVFESFGKPRIAPVRERIEELRKDPDPDVSQWARMCLER